MAQSTIFNIPSTDTVDKGKAYVEFDFLPQAPGPDVGGMITLYNPRLVVGLPHDVEVGVNFPIFHTATRIRRTSRTSSPISSGSSTRTTTWAWRPAAGVVVNTPLNQSGRTGDVELYLRQRQQEMWEGWSPGDRSGGTVWRPTQDPTSGPVSFVGKRGGAILGYEQPLGGPVSFVADWFSTQNTLGYFTPGVSIALPHSGLLNIGYSIGNDSWANSNATKNRYVFVYYGVTF